MYMLFAWPRWSVSAEDTRFCTVLRSKVPTLACTVTISASTAANTSVLIRPASMSWAATCIRFATDAASVSATMVWAVTLFSFAVSA